MTTPIVKPSSYTDVRCSRAGCGSQHFKPQIVTTDGEHSLILACENCGREMLFQIDLSPDPARAA